MGYASRQGRAVTNPSAPRAKGVCDRCGFVYQLVKLTYQHEWQGTKLQNLRLRVCRECKDVPQPQLKSKLIPPDPVPVLDPRPERMLYPNSTSFVTTEAGGVIDTEPNPFTNYPAGLPMEIPD